jgi:pre-mRNA-splicing factor 38A
LCVSLNVVNHYSRICDLRVVVLILEYFRYVRALGAVYLRLTGHPIEVYKYLEPLFNDYRKLRRMNNQGRECFYSCRSFQSFSITLSEFELFHMDELIDSLLRDERVCDIQMPRIQVCV